MLCDLAKLNVNIDNSMSILALDWDEFRIERMDFWKCLTSGRLYDLFIKRRTYNLHKSRL